MSLVLTSCPFKGLSIFFKNADNLLKLCIIIYQIFIFYLPLSGLLDWLVLFHFIYL